ncbi:MAG TPA: TolC family protein [Woeseiaceae bacterium]|nr:TolC family protein [Woeseiaceae bacterium]
MHSPSGRLPEHKHFQRACWLVVAGLIALPAMAQQNIPLTLAAAEDLALLDEPGYRALQARAAALDEQAVIAGELPEPSLRLGLNNFPIQSGGFSTEGMTNAAIGLRQAFPAGRSRDISTRQFELLSNEMSENGEARRRAVLAATRNAWLDVYYWDTAHRLVSESRPLFDDLSSATRSLYAVGRKSQQDVLRADLELSRLDDRIIEIERQRARARASLGEWIGINAGRPIADGLPAWEQLPPLDEMQQSLSQHPSLRAADALVDARGAGVELAKERSKPRWALDVGYSYRDSGPPSGMPRSDFVSVGVTVDLPFIRKRSVDSALSAALSERSAAKSERERMHRSLLGKLAAEYAHWSDLGRRLALYDSRILAQTQSNAEASLLAYRSDRGDFADVMRAYIDDLNARIDHVRLKVERAQTYAVLASLGGIPR